MTGSLLLIFVLAGMIAAVPASWAGRSLHNTLGKKA